MLAIQRHRAAIVQAQHQVLRREITMAEYNATYKAHLDAIHALERRLAELHGPPEGPGHGHGHGGAGQY